MPAAIKAWTCCLRPHLKDLSMLGVNGVRVLAEDLSKERELAAPVTVPCLLLQLLCHTAGWHQRLKSGICVFPWSCCLDPANEWEMLHFIGVAFNDCVAIKQLYQGARGQASWALQVNPGATGRWDCASLLCTDVSDVEISQWNILSSGNSHSQENWAVFEAMVPPLFPLRNFTCAFGATEGCSSEFPLIQEIFISITPM